MKKGLLILLVLIGTFVKAQPNCGFSLAADTLCIPSPILASASDVSANIIQRQWSLTTCTGALVFASPIGLNPKFSYLPATAGCYCLRLWVLNSLGDTCASQKCNILVVDTPTAVNAHVTPSIINCLPQMATLSLSANAGCGSITHTTVQWGCGNISSFNSLQDTVTHVYSASCNPQCYNVNVLLQNSCGCVSTIKLLSAVCITTNIYGGIEADSILCPGSTVCVTNNTTSGLTLTENWQFPGTTGTSSFTGHSPPCLTYPLAGDYPLVHQISNSTCTRSDTIIMHVCQPQLSGYLSDTIAACGPLAVCATNTSQCVDENTDVYTWNFGNGEYLERDPCDFYAFPGCYPVSLSVLTNNGCTDSVFIGNVCVGGPYVSSATVTPTTVCSCTDTVHFSISTVGATSASFLTGCNQGFIQVNPISTVGTVLNPTVLGFNFLYCLVDSCLPQITLADSAGCSTLYNLPWVYFDSTFCNIATNVPNIAANSFALLPNPATTSVTINVEPSLVGSTITVTDVTGRIVKAVQLQTINYKLETTNLSNGLYFVTIGNSTRKLVVSR